MLLHALAFAAGCALVAGETSLPDPFYGQFLPLAVLLYGCIGTRMTRCTRLCLIGIIGALWAATSAHLMLLSGGTLGLRHDVVLEGVVASIPRQRSYGTRFGFVLRAVDGAPVPLAHQVRLNWYGPRQSVAVGQEMVLNVRLRPALSRFNPGSFDYRGWLFRNGVVYTGYVRGRAPAAVGCCGAQPPMVQVERYRMALHGRLRAILSDHPMVGLVEALALGIRDAITQEQWQVLRRTGTAHLMAVSGLHIGLVAGVIFAGISWGWRRVPGLAFIAAPRAAAIGALGAALVYAALAGFSLPTQRALVMALVFFASVYLLRPIRGDAALGLAVLVMLLLSPASVMAPGLWLSCGAVAVLLYGMRGRGNGSKWQVGLRTQGVVAVGLTPLALGVFGESTLVGVVANAVAVPLVGGLVVPVVLLATVCAVPFPAVAEVLLLAAAYGLEGVFAGLSMLAAPDLQLRAGGDVKPIAMLLALGGVAWILAPAGFPVRWLGAVCLLPILCPPVTPLEHGQVQATVLDVGQGLAVVVRTQQHVLVYDTGPSMGATNATRTVVLPFLKHQGIFALDALVISHADDDHASGAATLREALPVRRVLGDTAAAPACHAGIEWWWDSVHFEFLHPLATTRGSRNDRSCVLRITTGAAVLLLPGDIEARSESGLLRHQALRLKATALVAPHHGSNTSSTRAWVRAVAPRVVVFSAGLANRFGFPHASVRARYRDLGARTYNTAHDGAVELRLEPSGAVAVGTVRPAMDRFWH